MIWPHSKTWRLWPVWLELTVLMLQPMLQSRPLFAEGSPGRVNRDSPVIPG